MKTVLALLQRRRQLHHSLAQLDAPYQRLQRARGPAFAVLVGILALGAVGNSDYADAIDTWSEEKMARVKRRTHEEPAVIWSKKCERKGKRVLAKQADGGKWIVSCVSGTGTRA